MLTTLAQVRSELDIQSTNTGVTSVTLSDDYIVKSFDRLLSLVEAYLEYNPVPRVATKKYNATDDYIDRQNQILYLRYPLLSVTSIVLGTGSIPASNEYIKYSFNDGEPYNGLMLLPNTGYRWEVVTNTRVKAISVSGIWGYHTNYSTAWLSSGDTVQGGGISATNTTLIVTDADGVDGLGFAPRFSAGNILKIGDEFLYITATNTTTNTLTVRRGVFGTTAVIHNAGTVISTYQPEPILQQVGMRWASFLYKRRGAFENVQFDGVATTSYPSTIPDDIQDMLDMLPNYNAFGVP